MAKRIKQFRFFNDKDSQHNSKNTTYQRLVSGTVFSEVLPILQLGIQALPGTKFYINNSPDPIMVGVNGVFELEMDGNTQITSLTFAPASLAMISKSATGGLIIDVTYESNEEEVV